MMYLQPPLPVNTQRYHNISDLYCLLYRCVVQTFLIMHLISKKKKNGGHPILLSVNLLINYLYLLLICLCIFPCFKIKHNWKFE